MALFDSQVEGAKDLYKSKRDMERFKKAGNNIKSDEGRKVKEILNEYGTTMEIFYQIILKDKGERHKLDRLRIESRLKARSACMD